MASPGLGLFSPILVFEQGTPHLPSWSNLASLPFTCYHPKLCPLFWGLLFTLFHSFVSCLRASRGPASDSNILVATSWAQLIVPSSRYSSSLLPPLPSFSLSLISSFLPFSFFPFYFIHFIFFYQKIIFKEYYLDNLDNLEIFWAIGDNWSWLWELGEAPGYTGHMKIV